VRFVDTERVHKRDCIARDQLGCIGIFRLIAVARATVVEGDTTIAFGEFRHLEFPSVEKADEPGDEDEGRALSALLDVKR
jgi:hypothetical protein